MKIYKLSTIYFTKKIFENIQNALLQVSKFLISKFLKFNW